MLFFETPLIYLDTFSKPIRSVADHITIVSKFVELSHFTTRSTTLPTRPSISIASKGKGRVTMISENRMSSMTFPFSLTVDENSKLTYTFKSTGEVTSTITSALSLISNQIKDTGIDSFLGILDLLLENDITSSPEELELLCDITFWFYHEESGHVRYDHDLKHMNEKIHPEHHLDVNYRNSSTFKLGLNSKLPYESFTALFEKNIDCLYLTQ